MLKTPNQHLKDRPALVWKVQGELTPIKDLSDVHLENIKNHILKFKPSFWNNVHTNQWLTGIKAEQIHRTRKVLQLFRPITQVPRSELTPKVKVNMQVAAAVFFTKVFKEELVQLSI